MADETSLWPAYIILIRDMVALLWMAWDCYADGIIGPVLRCCLVAANLLTEWLLKPGALSTNAFDWDYIYNY